MNTKRPGMSQKKRIHPLILVGAFLLPAGVLHLARIVFLVEIEWLYVYYSLAFGGALLLLTWTFWGWKSQ